MPGPVMELSDKIAVAAQLDVTDESSLRKIGATQVDVAVVTIGGLIYGTALTLFVVPCIYALFHKKEKARLREGIEEEPFE